MSHVATPADSAGGSNAATADDGHGANPIAANPVAAAALAGPGGAPAQPTPGAAPHHHAHPPPFASNPPGPAHALLHDADGQVWITPPTRRRPRARPNPTPRHPAARALDAKLRLHRPPMGGASHGIDIHRRPRAQRGRGRRQGGLRGRLQHRGGERGDARTRGQHPGAARQVRGRIAEPIRRRRGG